MLTVKCWIPRKAGMLILTCKKSHCSRVHLFCQWFPLHILSLPWTKPELSPENFSLWRVNKPWLVVYNGIISNAIYGHCSKKKEKKSPIKYKKKDTWNWPNFELGKTYTYMEKDFFTGTCEGLLQIKRYINWFNILTLTEVLSGKTLVDTVVSDENRGASL